MVISLAPNSLVRFLASRARRERHRALGWLGVAALVVFGGVAFGLTAATVPRLLVGEMQFAAMARFAVRQYLRHDAREAILVRALAVVALADHLAGRMDTACADVLGVVEHAFRGDDIQTKATWRSA